MAKQRGSKESRATEARTSESEAKSAAVDPSLVDQAALGNAVLQSRMEGSDVSSEGGSPDLDVVVGVAEPQVSRALHALQLDAANATTLDRRVGILERSRLPERETLIDQLQSDESARQMVEGLLDAHFGAHDAQAREAVDAVLGEVRSALQEGAVADGAWVAASRSTTLSEAVASGSLAERAAALIADLARDRASDGARSLVDDVGVATAGLVRSLALMVLLDEDEEEETEGEWTSVELD